MSSCQDDNPIECGQSGGATDSYALASAQGAVDVVSRVLEDALWLHETVDACRCVDVAGVVFASGCIVVAVIV